MDRIRFVSRRTWVLMGAVVVVGFACFSHLFAQVDSSEYRAALEALRYPQRKSNPAAAESAAIAHLEVAVQGARAPTERATMNLLLGRLYLWSHQEDNALKAHEAALAADPDVIADFPEAGIEGLGVYVGLGDCYKAKGDLVTAIQWWEKEVEREPEADYVMTKLMVARRELAQARQTGSLSPAVATSTRYARAQAAGPGEQLMVNARDIGQVLGVRAQVSGRTASARLTAGETTLALRAGRTEARLNGKPVVLPFAPVKAEGDLLVPLSFVVEQFGHKVVWEPLTKIAWVR